MYAQCLKNFEVHVLHCCAYISTETIITMKFLDIFFAIPNAYMPTSPGYKLIIIKYYYLEYIHLRIRRLRFNHLHALKIRILV